MHGYKWPINCTRTRTLPTVERGLEASGAQESQQRRKDPAGVADSQIKNKSGIRPLPQLYRPLPALVPPRTASEEPSYSQPTRDPETDATVRVRFQIIRNARV